MFTSVAAPKVVPLYVRRLKSPFDQPAYNWPLTMNAPRLLRQARAPLPIVLRAPGLAALYTVRLTVSSVVAGRAPAR